MVRSRGTTASTIRRVAVSDAPWGPRTMTLNSLVSSTGTNSIFTKRARNTTLPSASTAMSSTLPRCLSVQASNVP